MRILVSGASGQIATALREAAPAEVTTLGRPELDLENPGGFDALLERLRPDAVINAAAYTAVDKAESEPEKAFAVNATGAGVLAAACAARGLPFLHLSTDYVFDGEKRAPYLEEDATAPLTVYGASKLAGEKAVLAAHPCAVILRTAWVYAPYGQNFLRTMLRLAESRDEIGIVADQIGNPSYAPDIAQALLDIARHLIAAPQDDALTGIFHLGGAGEASWADFAESIFAGAARRGMRAARVRRISSADYPTPAKRPKNSRLDCGKLAQRHGIRLPAWQNGLERCLDRLLGQGEKS